MLVLNEQHREECWQRFLAAARDGRRQYYGKAQALVEKVRQEHGEQAARIARKELNAYIRSDKKL
ncbi:hypothetical protein CBA19CS22_37920 [Caballeronia novacaledonica]|uniref:Uncharacterized protein n=1 Tax=Caballeronia novacaledonica TaxID=1544861 RepID=A0ACB5R5U8_9BURK|nr:hypothetical protein CBA19CS22_37920 [Caballeronia novacaledonica]